MRAWLRIVITTLSATLPAASSVTLAAPDAGRQPQSATPQFGTWGFDLAGMSSAARAGDDFYSYANGSYVANLTIPADRPRFGSFDRLTELSQQRARAILEEAANAPTPDPVQAKLGSFYRSFTNEEKLEHIGIAALTEDLATIRALKSKETLAAVMGTSRQSLNDSIVRLAIEPDVKEPTRYAVYLTQAGLGLPDRDYYLAPQFSAQRAAYEGYIARLLELGGWPDPRVHAPEIMALETRIARKSWARADRRDFEKTYHPTTLGELERDAPGFPWRRFLANATLPDVKRVIAMEDTAIARIAAAYAETSLDTLRAWAAFHLLDNAAPYLAKDFSTAHFEFRLRTLQGVQEQSPRWKQAVAVVNGGMGEAIGQMYVQRHFPPAAKASMQHMVGHLKQAFRARLERIDWMSPTTRAEALEKLAHYTVKVGYPEKWRDYSGLVIRPDDLYGNVKRASAFDWAYRIGRLNEPVDRAAWGMLPQTVNAYNSAYLNEVVFPAAILQPPFFDLQADSAVNYGAIGAVIGHELIHGFDDQGRKFDAQGRLRDWWAPGDAKRFKAAAERLGAQYSAFEPLPGARINAQLTMGENIADLGGLQLALDAYRLSLQGKQPPVLDGMTAVQRVFLGWAQVWRAKSREQALRHQLVADPHSPEEFRVNGVVRNIDAWYEAFDIGPHDKLYLPGKTRVTIW